MREVRVARALLPARSQRLSIPPAGYNLYPAARVFAFQFVEHPIHRPTHAFAGLSQAAANAGHGIQLDRPVVVIAAIEEVLAMARGG